MLYSVKMDEIPAYVRLTLRTGLWKHVIRGGPGGEALRAR